MNDDNFAYGPDGRILRPEDSGWAERQRIANEHQARQQQQQQREDERKRKRQEEAAGLPWSPELDREIFRQPDSRIRKYTPEYYEFQQFYQRFLQHASARGKLADYPDEAAKLMKCIEYYGQFREQKLSCQRQSVQKSRTDLPISQYRQQIIDAVRGNQVTIVAADTGAGKSTQVPQFLLEAGFARIACTQPRRIACISLAKRVSKETMNVYGSEIGYQIRFDGTRSANTRILFLTEGLLLRQFSGDPQLAQYDVIIVDEVHERHALGDFLLGVLKRVLKDRPALKLVLMSATINSQLFSAYFDGAPLIEVPGRLYPVEVVYWPTGGEEDQNLVDPQLVAQRQSSRFQSSIPTRSPPRLDTRPFMAVIQEIDQRHSPDERGDLLIFVSGINEISALAEEVEEYAKQKKRWIVLRLHSSLSIDEQDKVFDYAPDGVRKCIISTNIAETSVTIDGIRFIIDSGRVREIDHDITANLSRLSEFWISQSSAKQRRGRAGRTGPGVCYRLYTEREHDCLNEFTVPEILRGPLEQIVLQIKALDLGNPRLFEFIESPPFDHLDHAINLLKRLGALDNGEQLTLLGHTLSLLPVDVVLGKMLILGAVFDLLLPVIIVAAALTVQSPFRRLSTNSGRRGVEDNDSGQSEVLRNRRLLESAHGDPFTLLNTFCAWIAVKADRRYESSRKWCYRHGLDEQRLYEMAKLVDQYQSLLDVHLGMSLTEDDLSREQLGASSRQGNDQRQNNNQRRRRGEAFERLQRSKSEKMAASKHRKVLSVDNPQSLDGFSGGGGGIVDAGPEFIGDQDEGQDLNSLEFEYRHNAELFHRKLARFSMENLNADQISILKLIICSGLYPNLAIPDEGNSSRRLSDHIFHTRTKRFAVIHPSSVFAANPLASTQLAGRGASNRQVASVNSVAADFLQAAVDGDLDLAVNEIDYGNRLQRRLYADQSIKNQSQQQQPSGPEFLCFLRLLETSKPFLMNLLRVPSLQTALLFGQCIETNGDFSCLVVDDWILIELKRKSRYLSPSSSTSPAGGEAEDRRITQAGTRLLLMTLHLRTIWSQLVGRKLLENRDGLRRGLRCPGGITGTDDDNASSLLHKLPFLSDQLPREFRPVYDRFSKINVSVNDPFALTHLGDDVEEKFTGLLEQFLVIDTLILDPLDVHYQIDTLRSEDLAALFPAFDSLKQFLPAAFKQSIEKDLDVPQAVASTFKAGLPVTHYLIFGSVHYPKSILQHETIAIHDSANSCNVGDSNVSIAEEPQAPILGHRRAVRNVWECPYCTRAWMVNEVEREEHLQRACDKRPSCADETIMNHGQASASSIAVNARNWRCEVCGEAFIMTPVERLKHRRQCTQKSC